MLPIVTSFTRERIAHEDVPKIAPCVLAVVVNRARAPEDMKLVPYESVLQSNKAQGVTVEQSAHGYYLRFANGRQDRQTHPTETAAHLSYWARTKKRAKKKAASKGAKA